MDRSPPLVLSFSTETRKPDKPAIREVIWKAAQSAFAAPLHLLNIMKPCSVPLVNIRLAWKDYRLTGQRGSLNFASVNQLSARCLGVAPRHPIPAMFYSLRRSVAVDLLAVGPHFSVKMWPQSYTSPRRLFMSACSCLCVWVNVFNSQGRIWDGKVTIGETIGRRRRN